MMIRLQSSIRLLVLLLVIVKPTSALGQYTKMVMDACATPGKEFPASLLTHFYTDNPRPPGPYYVGARPIPFKDGHIAAIYCHNATWPTDPRKFVRTYSFCYLVKDDAGASVSVTADDKDAEIKVIGGQFIRFRNNDTHWLSYERKDTVKEIKTRYYGLRGNDLYYWKKEDLKLVLNAVLSRYGQTLSEAEVNLFFSGFTRHKPSLEKIDKLVDEDEKDLMDELFRMAPGMHGYTRFKSEVPIDTLILKNKKFILNLGVQRVIMAGLPLSGGLVVGFVRSPMPGRQAAIPQYNFQWWYTDNYLGKRAAFELGSPTHTLPDPDVSVFHDHFVKVTFQYGQPVPRYLVLSERDLFQLADIPKEELPFHRNYIFARYGYKFKNPIYHEYFSQFDWYKPLNDNVDGKLTDDDKEVVRQIVELEKKNSAEK